MCVQVFNNKPSDLPQSSHQVSWLRSGGKARVNAEGGEGGVVSPQPAVKSPFGSRSSPGESVPGLAGANGGPGEGTRGSRTSEGRQVPARPPGAAVPPSTSPASAASPPSLWHSLEVPGQSRQTPKGPQGAFERAVTARMRSVPKAHPLRSSSIKNQKGFEGRLQKPNLLARAAVKRGPVPPALLAEWRGVAQRPRRTLALGG